MTPTKQHTVFLVNQFSQHGHLDMYARIYSACLLGLGYRVVLIGEQEGGVTTWLRERGLAVRESFTFLARGDLQMMLRPIGRPDQPSRSSCGHMSPSRIVRLWTVWREQGLGALLVRIGGGIRRWASRELNALVKLGILSASVAKRLRFWTVAVPFAAVIEEVALAERQLQLTPALVFFLYLDMMSESKQDCHALEKKLGAPWAGILFHPRLRPKNRKSHIERYFLSANARGALLLNPHLIHTYALALPGLTFAVAPDVTESATLPTDSSSLIADLRMLARARTIVLQFGTLAPHKGIRDLIEVIRQADPNRFYFAIVGELFWDDYEGDEELRRFLRDPPKNLLVRLGFVADERELNSLIAASDILYAVYRDFPDSSNNLTKSAIFEKPIIVADDYLMAERVRQYRLGAVARPGDAASILAGLEALRGCPRSDFRFATFRRDHSVDALRTTLGEAMALWLR